MLFILFDVEAIFLYPVAVHLKAAGAFVLVETLVFVALLLGRVRLRVAPGSARMEIRRSSPLEARPLPRLASPAAARPRCCAATSRAPTSTRYVEERVLTTTLEKALNWARSNSLFPATFGLACCAIEMMSIVTARYDIARFGAEVFRASPRQADMLILSGRVSIKMAPVVRRIYDQMLEPKWVIAMGACSSSAGVFNNYALVAGRRQVHAGRRPRARLPAAAGGADPRDPQAAAQDPGPPRPWAGASATTPHGTEELAATRTSEPDRAQMPDATGLELIAHDLREHFAGSVADTEHYRDTATLVVEPDQPCSTCCAGCATTRPRTTTSSPACTAATTCRAEPRFGVHYELLNMERVERLHVKALLADPGDAELPEIDSCVELFPTADFQEREIYDMFGVRFRGHPDLRRILMPEDYEGFPQRRDFPMGGEPVLFTHNEHETPRWYE